MSEGYWASSHVHVLPRQSIIALVEVHQAHCGLPFLRLGSHFVFVAVHVMALGVHVLGVEASGRPSLARLWAFMR